MKHTGTLLQVSDENDENLFSRPVGQSAQSSPAPGAFAARAGDKTRNKSGDGLGLPEKPLVERNAKRHALFHVLLHGLP